VKSILRFEVAIKGVHSFSVARISHPSQVTTLSKVGSKRFKLDYRILSMFGARHSEVEIIQRWNLPLQFKSFTGPGGPMEIYAQMRCFCSWSGAAECQKYRKDGIALISKGYLRLIVSSLSFLARPKKGLHLSYNVKSAIESSFSESYWYT